MPYLSVGALDPDKTPLRAPDVIRVWANSKALLRRELGVYKHPDGSPVVLDGRTLPLLTQGNARAIWEAWTTVGEDMSNALAREGRSTSNVTAARQRLAQNFLGWLVDTDDKYGNQKFLNKYLYAAPTKEFIEFIDRFVRDISSAQWAAFNIESSYDRALSVTPWPLSWVMKKGYEVAECLDNEGGASCVVPDLPPFRYFDDLVTIMKWGSLGGAAFLIWHYGIRKKT
jgi:hypothetical protein